jgi:endonuclease YncB( thermonuclease family)
MAHDFKRFPELSGEDLDLYYWASPFKQIFENFIAKVVRVKDGDTINVLWKERDFDFPVRFNNIAAPEKSEQGGEASRAWLERQVLNEEVEIIVDPNNRVGKWGRLLGQVISKGFDIGEMSILAGHSLAWSERKQMAKPEVEGFKI